MVESRMAKVPALVAKMIREDREFICAYTVSMFSQCSMPEAAVALTRLGYSPAQIGTLAVTEQNVSDPDGPLPVIVSSGATGGSGHGSERVFTVLRGGRRWTKVPEYLSNGQLTARWFVDEASGEVRQADGWKSPKSWPMAAEAAAFVLGIVAAFDAASVPAALEAPAGDGVSIVAPRGMRDY